jgi:5-methylcytosine-specific restriction endonuclease McrBC regulatory subunit McrC
MDGGSEITFQSKQESLSSHEVSSFPILFFVSLRGQKKIRLFKWFHFSGAKGNIVDKLTKSIYHG